MGALNIKDPKVAGKARALARLKGKSITAAVSEALDESLRSAESENRALREARAREGERILKRIRSYIKRGSPSPWKVLEDMYDEHGAPK